MFQPSSSLPLEIWQIIDFFKKLRFPPLLVILTLNTYFYFFYHLLVSFQKILCEVLFLGLSLKHLHSSVFGPSLSFFSFCNFSNHHIIHLHSFKYQLYTLDTKDIRYSPTPCHITVLHEPDTRKAFQTTSSLYGWPHGSSWSTSETFLKRSWPWLRPCSSPIWIITLASLVVCSLLVLASESSSTTARAAILYFAWL